MKFDELAEDVQAKLILKNTPIFQMIPRDADIWTKDGGINSKKFNKFPFTQNDFKKLYETYTKQKSE